MAEQRSSTDATPVLDGEAGASLFDPVLARTEKRAREITYHTMQIPALRALGMTAVLILVALHNVYLGGFSLSVYATYATVVGAYALGSWALLWLARSSSPRVVEWLSGTFLALDLAVWAGAVWISGADRSWLFFLFLIRVADQASTSFKRVLAYAHLATLCYAAVLFARVAGINGPAIPVSTALVKLAFVYLGNLYIATTARTSEALRRRTTLAVHTARRLNAELRAQAHVIEQGRLLAEQANLSKSEFLANMSHEIRTPMTAIQGYTDLLLDGELDAATRREHVTVIRRNSEHLLTILNDILDLSKIEAGKLQVERVRTSPAQVLSDVASLMRVRANAKHIAFSVVYDTAVPETIQTDPTRFRQILTNLVGNAIKFTDRGQVKIQVSCLALDSERPRLKLEVIDTGIGLSEEQRVRLFEPFMQADSSTTRRFGGTGLGLVISQRLAQRLGGDIAISSELGRGSIFSFELETGSLAGVRMLSDLREAGQNTVMRETTAQKLNGRILLAEDGVDNQRLICAFLRKAGLDVTVADNGRIAVERVAEAAATGTPFDVVIMDMQMPELDGYAATARLRGEGHKLPIIALTAHAMAGERERCLNAGCDEYITKPIYRADLISTVERFLPSTPA